MTLSERKHRVRKLIEQVERALKGAPTSSELETLQEDLIEAANHVKSLVFDVRKLEKGGAR